LQNKNILHLPTAVLLLTFILFGCTVIKHYPKDKPFFFENNIKINGSIGKQEKIDIKTRLLTQVEDSAQIKVASKIPWPTFPWVIPSKVMDSPTVYNKLQVLQSAQNMTNSMSSIGFRRSSILIETDTIIKKKQQRVRTNYIVEVGPRYRIDSVVYEFNDSALNTIVQGAKNKSIIVKGGAFDYFTVDQEINRLIELFQNNGYYKISKEDIFAEVDTNYIELLDPMLDAIEYARALAQVRLKRDKPEVDLFFRMRRNIDSNHYYQYRVGQFIVYPDLKETDTLTETLASDTSSIVVKSVHNTFNSAFIKEQVALLPGMLYKRENYSKTLNNFNKLGSWQNINLSSEPDDEKRMLNYILQLQPAKRQFFGIDMEGSSVINNSQLIQVGSGRVGIATNFTLRNRNIGKRAIQLENNLRTGIEFNNFQKILSGEITLTNRITFPWMVAPVGKKVKSYFQQARTIASADISYINRFKFFQLNTFNTFLGYEWKRNPTTTWQFRPLNLEYTQFRADSLFLESIKNFPLLRYTYNNGLLIGMNVMYNKNLTPSSTKHLSLLKIYAEESGLTTGALFYGLTKNGKVLSDLYRFFKMDAEFKHIINNKNSSLHFRAFAGAGFALTTGSRKGQVTLPFFKSYIAGGPNSMRGWSIRKLGIGSNIFYDTVAAGTFNDKYADVKLEGNVEYRFDLFQFYGFWMRGALFTDAGNIWFKNDLDGTLKNAGLKLKNLGRDMAVASGFGARVDFNYFLLRFDLGFPIKDPRYGPLNTGNANIKRYYSTSNGGWFVDNVWNKPTFQFAIGYPF
jgi:outer membrane protein insertion porin family